MIIITENSEEKLVKLMESIKGKASGLRCLHLHLSKFADSKFEPEQVANIVSNIINDNDSRIIFCRDGDVFIFSNLINAEIFEKLKLHVATFLDVTKDKLLAELYELNISWSVVYVVCENKLQKILLERKNAVQKIIEEKATQKHDSILNMPIEDELIKAFISSRKNRKEPEILIVEDDMFSRKLVSSSLSKEYKVMGAKDGRDAILQYTLHGPDVMFLDIDLPDLTGHEILKKILSFDPDAYIVMLSGKGDKENIMKAVHAGAKGFVGKPFTKEKLLQYINMCPTVKA